MPSDSTPQRASDRWLPLAVIAYLVAARTFGIHRSMWVLPDQMRDWSIALGPFSSLPLVGTPSTAGGVSLGPVYYWLIWLSRVTLGPFVDNLPHAGAYGISLIQSIGDLLLFLGLKRRTGSPWIALASVLLTATAPHDLAISGMVWNPAVSVAFVKLALGMRLLRPAHASMWWAAGATACSWFAVQAHSSAIFVAAPVVASFAVDDLVAGRWRGALERLRSAVEVMLLLQVPYLVYALTRTSAAAPTRALGNAADSVSSGLRVGPSLDALLRFVPSILFGRLRASFIPWLFAACLVLLVVRHVRDRAMLAATVAPLALAVLGFSLWRGNYDEYWYLPLAPCGAVAIVVALSSWRAAVSGPLLVALLLIAQPGRLQTSRTFYPMPQYGALVDGARQIRRQAGTVRRIDTTMTLPALARASFPFEAMGGRLSPDAPFDAVIDANGDVEFRRVR